MKAIIHLKIFVHGKHIANLHVTHMWASGRYVERYLKFRNFENTQILTIDTLGKTMWFKDSCNRIFEYGLSIK